MKKFKCKKCGETIEIENDAETHNLYEVFGLPFFPKCNTRMECE